MNKLPRYYDLVAYVRAELCNLCSPVQNPNLATFFELNHIKDLGIQESGDADTVGSFLLVIEFDSTIEVASPLEARDLKWLEQYFGAILQYQVELSGKIGFGSKCVFYRICRPNNERFDELYPDWSCCHWYRGEWQ